MSESCNEFWIACCSIVSLISIEKTLHLIALDPNEVHSMMEVAKHCKTACMDGRTSGSTVAVGMPK